MPLNGDLGVQKRRNAGDVEAALSANDLAFQQSNESAALLTGLQGQAFAIPIGQAEARRLGENNDPEPRLLCLDFPSRGSPVVPRNGKGLSRGRLSP